MKDPVRERPDQPMVLSPVAVCKVQRGLGNYKHLYAGNHRDWIGPDEKEEAESFRIVRSR
jgi:hypothetical protein